ncbi:MAG TPA: hypothetical protein VHE12_09955 [bacterium]|nr:hypothetical protein [bacterium]
MATWKGPILLLALGFLGAMGPGRAQTPRPYLTGATLYISVDDWADIWLNGIPIVDSQRRTPASKGFQTIQCLPDHLCYFHRDNVLAISNSNAYSSIPLPGDQVGLAYALHLRFSDGSRMVLTSNEVPENRSFYLADREEKEPKGWHGTLFDDSGWPSASNGGFHVQGLAELTDPETHAPVAFLTTRPGERPVPGERHLYRRRFSLDIGPSPYCPPSTRKGFWAEVPKGPGTYRDHPVLTTPTSVPSLSAVLHAPGTLTPAVVATPTEEALDIYRPLHEFLAQPTFTPTAVPVLSPIPAIGGEVIVFDRPPANIYVTFADGPGLYTVDVLDSRSTPIKRILEKKVIADHGEWTVWDGKDARGADSPPGDYWVLLSREGKSVNRVLVRKRPSP